ncbi:MAG: transglutaminaseTgpA domain-containing protein [Actinomycetota bacterium]|nr:transglutaminaseTgpA domain-containing protein [Actinomycetota bacterium]
MRRLLFVELAAVAFMAITAALGYQRIFVGGSFLWPVAGAAIAAVGIVALTSLRRFGLTASLLLSVVGLVIWTSYAVLGDTMPNGIPTLTTLEELARGVTGGWADLLTITLPARAEPRLLVVAVSSTWLAAAVGAEAATRSRSIVLPVIPSIVAYGVTLLIGSSEPRASWVLTAAFAALVLLCLLLHTNRRLGDDVAAAERPSSNEPSVDVSVDRRILAGLPVIAVAVLCAAAAASALPMADEEDDFDPRTLREIEVDERVAVSPLSSLKADLTLDPPETLFRLETAGLSDALQIPRIRLVVLDAYDGATWTSTAEYTSVGEVLPEPAFERNVEYQQVRQRYTIEDLDGFFLPTAGQPVTVEAGESLDVQYDYDSGSLLTDDTELEGVSYEVVSEIGDFDRDDLRFAGKVSDGDLEPYVETPDGVPAEITQLARTVTEPGLSPYEQLVLLEGYVRDRHGYNETIEPGHSLGALAEFLDERRLGYAEQFASSFALMARELGFSTRLVFGYLALEIGEEGSADASPLEEITTRQAHVWPEVYLDGFGWVDFEPTPQRVQADPPEEPPVTTVPPGVGDGDGGEGPTPGGPEVDVPVEDRAAPLDGRILVFLGLVLLLALLVAALILAKWLRRRSWARRAVTPSQHILAHWAIVRDRLLEVGLAAAPSMTPKEVAGSAADGLAEDASAALAAMVPLVDVAVCAPTEPREERAEEMAALAAQFEAGLWVDRSIWQRVRATLNPRPLIGAASTATQRPPESPSVSAFGSGIPRPS